jgi:hypothetical protein
MLNALSHKLSIDYKSHNLFNIYVTVLSSAANNNYFKQNFPPHNYNTLTYPCKNLRPVRQASEGLVRRWINKDSHWLFCQDAICYCLVKKPLLVQ